MEPNTTRLTERPSLDEWLDMAADLLDQLEPQVPAARRHPKAKAAR